MERERKFWVMDYETIVNCFVACFTCYDSEEQHVFVVNRERNDMPRFIEFLKENLDSKDWHFGYNNLSFDAQITEYILQNLEFFRSAPASDITTVIYKYAQRVIEKSNNKEFLDYPEFKLSIPCVDIFKLNHWDSMAKRTSLKWVQFSMDWHNVEEMPHQHNVPVEDDHTLDMIINYCINDVQSTKKIFNYTNGKGEKVMVSQVNLRAELSKTYGINLLSASEPRISKEIFLHFLSEKLKRDKKAIRDLRTERPTVTLRDIMLPYIKFTTPEFNSVHNWFKSLTVDTAILNEDEDAQKKKGPKYRLTYSGVPTDYGLGGLHGCIKSGIYTAGNGKKIMSADVTSFYPRMAIVNRWSPAHIPQEDFCELYEWFFEERLKYPKSSPLNYLFKIVLNSTYGLSKNRYSFLYDPEFTFRITVNGQLLLSMLYERVMTKIPGAQPLMQNTDGLEFMIDEEYEPVFYEICREWEALTKLQLETVEYQKMIIGDVNNYIAIDTKGKTKCKGRFEFEELALHKNKSMQIIPKAWYEYFVKGKDPAEYLKENKNIFDYCAGAKLKGEWSFKTLEVVRTIPEEYKDYTPLQKSEFLKKNGWEESWSSDNWVRSDATNKEANTGIDTDSAFFHTVATASVMTDLHKKLIRYYISKKGSKIIKCNPDGREIQLESGKPMQTIFNKYVEKEWDAYDLDEKYYLDKIYDEIRKIESDAVVIPQKQTQLSLF